MYCKKCGSMLRDDAVFCLKCGTQVKQTINTDIHNINETGKATNKKKMLIPVIGCMAVVLAVVVAVVAGMGKSKGEPMASTETVIQESAEEIVEESVAEETEVEVEEKNPILFLTKEATYLSDGSLVGWYEYIYDSQGNNVQKIRYDRNGNISTYEEWDSFGNELKNFSYDNGKIYYGYENEYDTQGHKLKEIIYQSDGSIGTETEYSYDVSWNCIKEITCTYGENGYVEVNEREMFYNEDGYMTEVKGHFYNVNYDNIGVASLDYTEELEYDYDENGKVMAIIQYVENGLVSCSVYEYLDNGEKRKYVEYDSSGKLIYRYEDVYDADGKKVQNINYEDSAMAFSDVRTEYTYDSNGYLIGALVASVDEEGLPSFVQEVEYVNDNNGKVMKKIIDNGFSFEEEEYNSQGVLIKSVIYNNDGHIEGLWEYDNYGNLIKESHPNRDYVSYLTCEYKYAYDEYGNVLKRYNYEDGILIDYTDYVYEDMEKSAENYKTYDSILNNVLAEQQKLNDATVLKYSYLFYDFNEDGRDELLLRKTEYDSRDTLYIYSLIDNEIKIITERPDAVSFEWVSGLTRNGFIIEGTVTNGCEYHHYAYGLKDNDLVLIADFHRYEYEENAFNYEINVAGETKTTTDKTEYEQLVNQYLLDNIVVLLPYNSVRWNSLK